MQIIKSIQTLRKILSKARAQNKKIGFVPTMGAFHEGHLSLMKKCRKENDLVVVSIFVNPTQFRPGEDFKDYPRDKKNDVLLAKKENIDIIFYPSVDIIYTGRYLTTIKVKEITNILCGKSRPTHFEGVATVVAKLLNIIQPDTMYLGQKDVQQCVVLKQMVRDLNFPVVIRVLPTVREFDGLAMSSRNKYLSKQQRQEAPVLYQSLISAKQKILRSEQSTTKIINAIRSMIQKNTSGKIDYAVCLNADSLQPLKVLRGKILIALAVRFGQARLIDNILFKKK